MNESADSLLKDPACQKSKEHFSSALRVLELVQTQEIEMVLDTIIGVSNQLSSYCRAHNLGIYKNIMEKLAG